jgi:hypothetical protein
MLEIVSRLLIPMSMSVSFSIDVASCEVAKRWMPFSVTPMRFSKRNDCRFAGTEFRAMLVNEVAASPEIERCRRWGKLRNVPMTARKLRRVEDCSGS